MSRIFAVLLVTMAGATAHDLQLRHEVLGRSVIVEARYAGTEPCAFAAVTIFSPADARSEYQNGRTDASGNFSFVPNRPGDWKFIVDDEIGHRQELRIAVGGVAAGTTGGTQPSWQKALTGGALIAGLTGVLYGWKSRRPR